MKYLLISILFISIGGMAQGDSSRPLPPWQKGFMDIHHINTGRGNAAFFVFPDGTTLLFDAGDLNAESFVKKNAPLKVTPAYPNDSLTPGGWIVNYIKQVLPSTLAPQIDYAAISHFHADHYGNVTADTKASKTGAYQLTGITEVGEYIPVKQLIDRGLSFPTPLDSYYSKDATFRNYLLFARWQQQQHGLVWQPLQPGSDTQIVLKHDRKQYPSFAVRNIKANGTIWTGKGDATRNYFTAEQVLDKKGNFNENPLSLALKISYGRFDYYTGGDNTGLQGYDMPSWFDVETPVAKATGGVDVLTMDHHGNRDATNEIFLKTLQPAVVVQQVWCSDHPGQEVLHRLITAGLYQQPPDIFSTNMHKETKIYMGPWLTRNYKSMDGHILIRVTDGGQQYKVYILKNKGTELRIVKEYGPYESR